MSQDVMTERDELLASMYDDENAIKAVPVENTPGTRKIRVGIAEYEVPTVDYVRHLEHLLTQQAHLINQQQRAIHRIETTLAGTRNFMRRYGDAIGDIRTQLTRKVDFS